MKRVGGRGEEGLHIVMVMVIVGWGGGDGDENTMLQQDHVDVTKLMFFLK